MNALVIGGGGREHALAWKLAQSPRVEKVYVAPGNGGTAAEDKVENIPLAPDAIAELIVFAKRNAVALTIVGPEGPLVAGVVDEFTAAGLPCLGPSKAAAALEGSKHFAKAFMQRHGIPTAEARSFTELDAALAHIDSRDGALVVKADGLAAGKGVVVADAPGEAREAARAILSAGKFGAAGRRIIVEERLKGEELSFIALADGSRAAPLASSQDHKTRDDGGRGPNTGGMGACSPAPLADPALREAIMQRIIRPTLRGMAAEGRPYRGFLYAGLMVDAAGEPKTLEFNCRLGDPETQPLLMRLRSDLSTLCELALAGKLDEASVDWDPRPAVGVVMASKGYPEFATKGREIFGLEGLEAGQCQDLKVFHAGTRRSAGRTLTNGGRVLCVTALGSNLARARDKAYGAVRALRCEALFCRADIARLAAAREAGG